MLPIVCFTESIEYGVIGVRLPASPLWRTGPAYVSSGGSEGIESACSAEDLGSTPGSGRSLGEENGNPLQYSCLDNPMDRGAWRATAHGVTKSWT